MNKLALMPVPRSFPPCPGGCAGAALPASRPGCAAGRSGASSRMRPRPGSATRPARACAQYRARPGGQPGPGLLPDMRGVAARDDADDLAFRIVDVEVLRESDELPGAVPPLDIGDDLPGVQVQRGKDRQGAVAPVLAVPGHLRMPAGNRRHRAIRGFPPAGRLPGRSSAPPPSSPQSLNPASEGGSGRDAASVRVRPGSATPSSCGTPTGAESPPSPPAPKLAGPVPTASTSRPSAPDPSAAGRSALPPRPSPRRRSQAPGCDE